MIGRRSAIGLALLCAFAFCAFAAQGASAVVAKNTTAVTCVKGGGEEDFEDAHCDVYVGPEEGEYGHIKITNGETTEITVTNETTGGATDSAILKGTLAGVNVEITCSEVHGEGTIHNIEPVANKHEVTGKITTTFNKCEVKKPAKCTVKEPITVEAEFNGVEELGAGKNEMGVEFTPPAAKKGIFVVITLENKGAEKCALNGKALEVEGTAIATGAPKPTEKHTGSTSIFTNEMTSQTLKIGGKAAEFAVKTTVKMKQKAGGEVNPISLTTT